MPRTTVIETVRKEIEDIDKGLLELEDDRKKMMEDRAEMARILHWLTGENVAEISMHVYENSPGVRKLMAAGKGKKNGNGHANGNGKKNYRYEPKVGQEPTPGTKKYQVLEALRKLGPMTSGQIADMLDYQKNALSAQLVLLGHQHLVARSDDGFYRALTADDVAIAANA